MAETLRDAVEKREAERRAIMRDVVDLARRADAAGLSPIARVLDLAMAMMDSGEAGPQPHPRPGQN